MSRPEIYEVELSPSEAREGLVLWLRYFLETETFDRRVCRNRDPKTGDAILTTPDELRRCNENARVVRGSLGLKAKSYPEALYQVSGWSTERQLAELRALRPDLAVDLPQ